MDQRDHYRDRAEMLEAENKRLRIHLTRKRIALRSLRRCLAMAKASCDFLVRDAARKERAA